MEGYETEMVEAFERIEEQRKAKKATPAELADVVRKEAADFASRRPNFDEAYGRFIETLFSYTHTVTRSGPLPPEKAEEATKQIDKAIKFIFETVPLSGPDSLVMDSILGKLRKLATKGGISVKVPQKKKGTETAELAFQLLAHAAALGDKETSLVVANAGGIIAEGLPLSVLQGKRD